MALVVLPRQVSITADGVPRVGASLYFYEAGTSTPITTYTTPDYSVEHPNPVPSESTGYWPAIHVNPAEVTAYKIVAKDENDATFDTQDNVSPLGDLTQAAVGSLLWPRTALETSEGVTPSSPVVMSSATPRLVAMACRITVHWAIVELCSLRTSALVLCLICRPTNSSETTTPMEPRIWAR